MRLQLILATALLAIAAPAAAQSSLPGSVGSGELPPGNSGGVILPEPGPGGWLTNMPMLYGGRDLSNEALAATTGLAGNPGGAVSGPRIGGVGFGAAPFWRGAAQQRATPPKTAPTGAGAAQGGAMRGSPLILRGLSR